MKLNRKNAQVVQSAIRSWVAEDVISPEQGEQLQAHVQISHFDWQRLAHYSFWIAIICIIVSVSAILSDKYLMALLEKLFSAPQTIKFASASLLTAGIYYVGVRRRSTHPQKRFSNEALFFLGVLGTALSITLFGQMIQLTKDQSTLLLLLAALTYGVLALWFPSILVWFFALLSLGSWFGAETGYISGWGAYFLGMNFPLRFVLFGLALIALSGLFHYWTQRRNFSHSTQVMGLLYFFIALWIMSIFGNYGDLDQWQKAGHGELLKWSLLFGVAAIVAIVHGIRYDNATTRGFGLTFLFINLYTRYFEYFWENTHKALFFAVLAISFWYLGSQAERIWSLGQATVKKAPEG